MHKKLNILIFGGRTFPVTKRKVQKFLEYKLTRWIEQHGFDKENLIFWSGDANGADQFHYLSKNHDSDLKLYPANWQPNGRNQPTDFSAGYKRNKKMFSDFIRCPYRLAVMCTTWNARENGTAHMRNLITNHSKKTPVLHIFTRSKNKDMITHNNLMIEGKPQIVFYDTICHLNHVPAKICKLSTSDKRNIDREILTENKNNKAYGVRWASLDQTKNLDSINTLSDLAKWKDGRYEKECEHVVGYSDPQDFKANSLQFLDPPIHRAIDARLKTTGEETEKLIKILKKEKSTIVKSEIDILTDKFLLSHEPPSEGTETTSTNIRYPVLETRVDFLNKNPIPNSVLTTWKRHTHAPNGFTTRQEIADSRTAKAKRANAGLSY